VTLPEYLLDLPAEEAARLIVLGLLDQAVDAGRRVADLTDPAGLHDFRVAVRRLRSGLQAFRPEIGAGLPKHLRRRLARLARATGRSRDLEVHLAWERGQEAGLTARQRAGLQWHVNRLEARRRRADRRLARLIGRRFVRLQERFRHRLEGYRLRIERDPSRRRHEAAAVLGGRIRKFAGDLEWRLSEIRGLRDRRAAHRARIAAKRLRYLLEPIRAEVDGVEPLIASLRQLQDLLGELHDSQTQHAALAGEVVAAGREHDRRLLAVIAAPARGADDDGASAGDDPRPGLLALIELLEQREAEAFATLRTEWLLGSADGFFEAVGAIGRQITHRPACVEEIQRRFLLRRVPATAQAFALQEIDQGWLPGTRVVERIRSLRRDARPVTYRTTRWSTGAAPAAPEGEVDQTMFDEIWPLTAGRRVAKRRHVVTDYGMQWEIDQFLDRDLVIADVAVAEGDTPVVVPEWLQPYIVREVTGDGAYTSLGLAR
jgi:CHAD domain-containing protein/CYTH domain-containing protein